MLSLRMVDRLLACRPFTPVLIGICVGISISLIVTNAGNDSGCMEKSSAFFGDIFDKSHSVESLFTDDSKIAQDENTEDLSDYDPRINLAGKPHSAKKEPQTLIRPRYLSTELGIKEKNFVAVLSSIKQIPTLGLAINETLAHHVNRLAFFVEVVGNDKLDVKTLPIVGFKDSQQGLLTLHTLKYLADKLAVGYSYFFLIKDTTYVDGRKLDNLTKHISITENVYMGLPGTHPTSNPSVCSLDSGILISSSVLLAISPLLETCTEDFAFNSDDEKIGLCIFKALNLTCQSQVQGQTFSTFNLDAHISDVRQLEKIWESQPALSNALTFFHARETSYFFMLNKQTCEVALRNIKNSIRDLESSILRLAPDAPGGLEAVTWPIGYSPPSKQDTRFSVLHWKYFNETHVFFDTENSVVKPLSGPNLEDIQEVISAAVKSVLKESPELSYLRVVSSYKRFDPTRGMDYRLHLLFKDPVKGKITVRMEGCRPITHVDTVPMPYVTESSVVHIVLVLRDDDEIAPAERFISSFAKNMMAKSDKSELTLVLLNRDAGNFKSLAQTLNAQYKKQGSKISILSSKISSLNRSGMDFIAVDLISSKVEPGTLIFLCNPFTEIYPDVLNRVRINTISGWQLFSPIPFAEYNPEVSFPGLSKTEALNISTNQGFYDVHETQHISFYMADYLNARKTFEMEQPLVKSDRDLQGEFSSPHESILAMFTRMRQLHILRAVEPHLRIRYHERKCETRRCRESFLLSQGTRSQLAQFALDRESPALTE
ncbi:chondroitin sulfate glucuronyltransferase-like [Daphnia pulex]|uniref:chondroitin sulfate glucuronyltransferase-like n=1 Tax=Daphnia pulex TaxID=6669 RepID=UPI001EDCF97E|nr:chondroitin sulfate glucuronyltransferase-like [Daphnia pulex]